MSDYEEIELETYTTDFETSVLLAIIADGHLVYLTATCIDTTGNMLEVYFEDSNGDYIKVGHFHDVSGWCLAVASPDHAKEIQDLLEKIPEKKKTDKPKDNVSPFPKFDPPTPPEDSPPAAS